MKKIILISISTLFIATLSANTSVSLNKSNNASSTVYLNVEFPLIVSMDNNHFFQVNFLNN